MTCSKCGYQDKKHIVVCEVALCQVCATFAPRERAALDLYVEETIDWKTIDTFRRTGALPGEKKKAGMHERAKTGALVTRAPRGYSVVGGTLTLNHDAIIIRSLFKTFLSTEVSLNHLAREYKLSVNGLKKILSNRTYLGEIKFDAALHKATHEPLIAPEMFYAVQRKLSLQLRPRAQPKTSPAQTQSFKEEDTAAPSSTLYSTVFDAD